MAVVAMFKCKEVTTRESFSSDGVHIEVKLEACIHGEGNEDWSKWTPAGEMSMTITNPSAEGFFEPGEDYKIVISKRQPQKARTIGSSSYGADDNINVKWPEGRESGEINTEET